MDILNIDKWLFFLINHGSVNPLFDVLMPVLSNRGYLLALPFGAYVIALALRQPTEKRRQEVYFAVWTLVVAIISFIFADWITNEVKYFIERIRPCNALEGVRLLGGCSNSFSMPSGHSTNSFAYAIALFIMTKGRVSLPWRIYPLVLAALVAYSRPYLGVHYPGDVIMGAVVGLFSALTMVALFRFASGKYKVKPYMVIFVGLLITTGIIRFYHVLRGPLDLGYEEAFSRLFIAMPGPSGLSAGPMTTWLIALGSALFGDTVFGIRIFAAILSTLSFCLMFRLAKEMYSDKAAALWAAVLLLAVPAFSLPGVVLTHEAPLILFWLLSLLLFYRAAQPDAKESGGAKSDFRIWIHLGITVGLGVLTSYMMIFFYAGMFIALLMTDKKYLLRTAGPYVSLLIGLCPIIILNVINGQALPAGSEIFAGESGFSISGITQFVSLQMTIITPLALALIFYALHLLFYKDRGFRSIFLFAFSLPVLILSLIACILLHHQPGLAITGYLTGLIAIAFFFFRTDEAARLTARVRTMRHAIVWAAVAVALSITAISYFPNMNRLSPQFDPVIDYRGWRELGADVDVLSDQLKSGGPVSIISDDCGISAELAFYMKERPMTSCINPAGRYITLNRTGAHFYQSGKDISAGERPAIVVTSGDRNIPPAIGDSCERIGKKNISVKHKGREIKAYSAFICYNLKHLQGGPSK